MAISHAIYTSLKLISLNYHYLWTLYKLNFSYNEDGNQDGF